MSHAKLYEFSSKFKKDPMSIPLPEMARKVLECQNEKVYRCYKENGEFDVVIGAKNDEEVKEVCGEPCEVINAWINTPTGPRDIVLSRNLLPHKFSGYICHHKKSGAIHHGPTRFWWKKKIQKREKKDVYGGLYKRTEITIKYIPLKPEDILLEYIMRIILVQQDATIFKMPFNFDADSDVVVFAGTSDKELAKSIFHQRFWINPDQEALDYVEKNLVVWECKAGKYNSFLSSDLIREGTSNAVEVYQEEVLKALELSPNFAIANLVKDFITSFLDKLEIGEKHVLLKNIFNASIKVGNKFNERHFKLLIQLLFSPTHLDIEPKQKKEVLWNFASLVSKKYETLGEKDLINIIKTQLYNLELGCNESWRTHYDGPNGASKLIGWRCAIYEFFNLLQKVDIYNNEFNYLSKDNIVLILTHLFELENYYELFAHLWFTLTWSYARKNRDLSPDTWYMFTKPGDIIKDFLTKKLFLKHLYSKTPEDVTTQVNNVMEAVFNFLREEITKYLNGEPLPAHFLNNGLPIFLSKLDKNDVIKLVNEEVQKNCEGYTAKPPLAKYLTEKTYLVIYQKNLKKNN